MTETEWLSGVNAEARSVIGGIIDRYDDGHLSLADAKHRLAVVIEGLHTRIYDHAVSAGVAVGVAKVEADQDDEDGLDQMDMFEGDDLNEDD